MMDFDQAATRLTRDQQTALARSRAQKAARTSSASAKRDAAASRARADRRLREKKMEAERRRRAEGEARMMVRRLERELGVVRVDSSSSSRNGDSGDDVLASGWKLSATSIHGDGDKIALPPSALRYLTSSSNDGFGDGNRPLAFRVGVLDEKYGGFPAGEKMKALVDSLYRQQGAAEDGSVGVGAVSVIAGSANSSNDALTMPSQQLEGQTSNDDDMMDDSDGEESSTLSVWREAYLDELSHRYLAYTHGTVVEFTQEEGCVGLPEPIARALLRPNAYSLVRRGGVDTEDCTTQQLQQQRQLNNDSINDHRVVIPTKRTVDPAVMSTENLNDDSSSKSAVKQQDQQSTTATDTMDEEKTPGHPAYNKFDIPSLPIEIVPIKYLPPGKDCTFTPTPQSIRNGFYDLKDIKSVLEQSLMRTRATLSMGDVIRTWRRGVSFDLVVSKLSSVVSSDCYGAVSCVNTDLNVDIGVPEGERGGGGEDDDDTMGAASRSKENVNGTRADNGGGRTLAGPSLSSLQPTSTADTKQSQQTTNNVLELPPEPPENETAGVCTVQIRGGGIGTTNSGRRRFKTNTCTIGDLFSFASNVSGHDLSSFRLVTRFPRKVYRLSSSSSAEEDSDETDCYEAEDLLENVGIVFGQILFMIEKL